MVLKPGITSFFPSKEITILPEFSFSEFKHVAYGIARDVGLSVSHLNESGITPNFHHVRLSGSENCFDMLGHATYPLIAFSAPWEAGLCKLRFIDAPRISLELHRLFPYLRVLTTHELNQALTCKDLELLYKVERVQIKYWKPTSVGEVVFNWWN